MSVLVLAGRRDGGGLEADDDTVGVVDLHEEGSGSAGGLDVAVAVDGHLPDIDDSGVLQGDGAVGVVEEVDGHFGVEDDDSLVGDGLGEELSVDCDGSALGDGHLGSLVGDETSCLLDDGSGIRCHRQVAVDDDGTLDVEGSADGGIAGVGDALVLSAELEVSSEEGGVIDDDGSCDLCVAVDDQGGVGIDGQGGSCGNDQLSEDLDVSSVGQGPVVLDGDDLGVVEDVLRGVLSGDLGVPVVDEADGDVDVIVDCHGVVLVEVRCGLLSVDDQVDVLDGDLLGSGVADAEHDIRSGFNVLDGEALGVLLSVVCDGHAVAEGEVHIVLSGDGDDGLQGDRDGHIGSGHDEAAGVGLKVVVVLDLGAEGEGIDFDSELGLDVEGDGCCRGELLGLHHGCSVLVDDVEGVVHDGLADGELRGVVHRARQCNCDRIHAIGQGFCEADDELLVLHDLGVDGGLEDCLGSCCQLGFEHRDRDVLVQGNEDPAFGEIVLEVRYLEPALRIALRCGDYRDRECQCEHCCGHCHFHCFTHIVSSPVFPSFRRVKGW